MKKRELNISNHEAWMLDRLEGQLSADEELRLEHFLATHPSLDDEPVDLDELTLSPESLLYPDSDSLKMPDEEDMLLISALEAGSDGTEFSGEALREFARYQKTILLADERIVYPDKASLKQEDTARIIPLWLTRVAIAASLIGIVLTLLFQTRTETYQPRLSKSDLPTIELSFPSDPPNNYAEQGLELRPDESPQIHDTPLGHMAQEEQDSQQESTSDPMPLYNPIEGQALDVAESSEMEVTPLEIEAPELDIAQEVELLEDSISTQKQVDIADITDIETGLDVQDIAEVPETGPRAAQSATETNTREFSSVLDVLKHATRESDVLALQDVKEESAYVETSLKVGRFQLAVKRRKKN